MKILVIPDLHIPFHHRDAFKFLHDVISEKQPDKIICTGDLADFSAFSSWHLDPQGLSAVDELKMIRRHISKLVKFIPKLLICLGNHDLRIYKKAFKTYLPKILFKSLHDILGLPNKWEFADYHIVDNIRFEHGDAFGFHGSGMTAIRDLPLRNMQSTVFGHFHTYAGILYLSNPRMLFFGFNVGCLIDKSAYAFLYGKHWKLRPILGCGYIENGIPQFIPMLLNKRGRYIK